MKNEKLQEVTILALQGKLFESTKYIKGQEFEPDARDLMKMKEYKNKGSNPVSLAKSVKDVDKALSRYFIACAMNWSEAKEAFYDRIAGDMCREIGLDDYREILNDLEEQAKNYDIPDEYKANGGSEEYPLDEKTEKYLRLRFSKLYKLLKQNNLEYKLTRREPTSNEINTDYNKGLCWTIACTLTVKFPNGNIEHYQLANHTNEAGGSFGVSCSTLGIWEDTQTRLAELFQKEIDKNK